MKEARRGKIENPFFSILDFIRMSAAKFLLAVLGLSVPLSLCTISTQAIPAHAGLGRLGAASIRSALNGLRISTMSVRMNPVSRCGGRPSLSFSSNIGPERSSTKLFISKLPGLISPEQISTGKNTWQNKIAHVTEQNSSNNQLYLALLMGGSLIAVDSFLEAEQKVSSAQADLEIDSKEVAKPLMGTLSAIRNLESLTAIFRENYHNFYRASRCGQNVKRLILEAQRLNIDLSNSYVLKIEGGDFLETSGFYTRDYIGERAMLGYFHFILVSEAHIFDFDLDEPLVLPLEEYVRLQFVPPSLGYKFMGIDMNPREYLPLWTVEKYTIDSYLSINPQASWSMKMGELIDIDRTIALPRR